MLSFELRDPRRVDGFLRALRWFTLGESLGGVESLVARPATMSHASMTAEVREKAGIRDGLIRVSAGIEDAEDLIGDLRQALEGCKTDRRTSRKR
jgi:cystathionine gamma-synthase